MFGFTSLVSADDINGYIVPEYYFVADQNNADLSGQHGFWIRRIYFGYDTKFDGGWSARVRFEMNSPAFEEGTLIPYIKNAHLKKSFDNGMNLLVGIIEPPSFDRVEKFWGYRYIEKTAPDFWKQASSRDFGVAIDGKTKGGIVYTVMYGNYSSNKSEDNAGKAVYGRLGYESKALYIEANAHVAADGGKDKSFYSLFGGFKGGWGRLGAGYTNYTEKEAGMDDFSNGIISAFGAVKFGKDGEVFARYDILGDYNHKDIGDYIPVPAKSEKAGMLIAGLNFKINKMIDLSPNVRYVHYADSDLSGDLYFNLTAKVSFKSVFGEK
jgi:hypothetical protein